MFPAPAAASNSNCTLCIIEPFAPSDALLRLREMAMPVIPRDMMARGDDGLILRKPMRSTSPSDDRLGRGRGSDAGRAGPRPHKCPHKSRSEVERSLAVLGACARPSKCAP